MPRLLGTCAGVAAGHGADERMAARLAEGDGGAEMSRYAEGTTTQVSTTQEEIRRTLKRYGVTKSIFYEERGYGLLQFEAHGRQVRFTVEMPAFMDFGRDAKGHLRGPETQRQAYEREERRRWRVLLLLLKGKLEVVADESVNFDREFMGAIVLPDGSTVADNLEPRVDEAYQSGRMPDMLDGVLPPAPRLRILPPPKEMP